MGLNLSGGHSSLFDIFSMGFEGHTQGMWSYGSLPLSSLARGTNILVFGFGRSYPTGFDLPKLSGCPCTGSVS